MKVACIDFSETGQFAPIFTDFIQQKEVLQPFYHQPPTLAAFEKQIAIKANSDIDRILLAEVLLKQYKKVSQELPVTQEQIESLKSENTYTVTTGHQLNIFTGPLYFHFKIMTVINACEQLRQKYPNQHFVPVYWMASEDHDLDEIRSFQMKNQKFKWTTEQIGAVGRMKTNGLVEIAEAVGGKESLFYRAYQKAGTLADAVRDYVNELYGEYGLLVLDADCPELKKKFQAVIETDLFEHIPNELVKNQSDKLDQLGYKSQTYPRAINFFYLKDDLRERITVADGRYQVLGTEISFSKEEIAAEIKNHPERFSPNVILRPLYQEMILPNLAYTGGPAEVAYWMQLKPVFDHFSVAFPILLPRNFGLIIPNLIKHKIKKLKLGSADLFLETEKLKKQLTKTNSAKKLELNDERQQLLAILHQVKEYAADIDLSLLEMARAETQKVNHTIDKIEKKMLAAEKRKLSDKMRQVDEIKAYLFPGNGLQERKENFLPFYQADKNIIEKLMKSFDPFQLKFHIIRWDG